MTPSPSAVQLRLQLFDHGSEDDPRLRFEPHELKPNALARINELEGRTEADCHLPLAQAKRVRLERSRDHPDERVLIDALSRAWEYYFDGMGPPEIGFWDVWESVPGDALVSGEIWNPVLDAMFPDPNMIVPGSPGQAMVSPATLRLLEHLREWVASDNTPEVEVLRLLKFESPLIWKCVAEERKATPLVSQAIMEKVEAARLRFHAILDRASVGKKTEDVLFEAMGGVFHVRSHLPALADAPGLIEADRQRIAQICLDVTLRIASDPRLSMVVRDHSLWEPHLVAHEEVTSRLDDAELLRLLDEPANGQIDFTPLLPLIADRIPGRHLVHTMTAKPRCFRPGDDSVRSGRSLVGSGLPAVDAEGPLVRAVMENEDGVSCEEVLAQIPHSGLRRRMVGACLVEAEWEEGLTEFAASDWRTRDFLITDHPDHSVRVEVLGQIRDGIVGELEESEAELESLARPFSDLTRGLGSVLASGVEEVPPDLLRDAVQMEHRAGGAIEVVNTIRLVEQSSLPDDQKLAFFRYCGRTFGAARVRLILARNPLCIQDPEMKRLLLSSNARNVQAALLRCGALEQDEKLTVLGKLSKADESLAFGSVLDAIARTGESQPVTKDMLVKFKASPNETLRQRVFELLDRLEVVEPPKRRRASR